MSVKSLLKKIQKKLFLNAITCSVKEIVHHELEMHSKFIINQINYTKMWKENLYTPTQFQKIGNKYFIIDCWHHRILYSSEMDAPVSGWRILTSDVRANI